MSHPVALITGASSGIGATFARRLAADGYDLILVARRQDRLEALANELSAQHGIVAEALAADLSIPADVQRVAERIAACDTLTLLINNAGFGTPGRFAELDVRDHLAMLQVHLAATISLTRAALPGMIARRRGGIINVSSVAAFIARGSNTMYHTTKAALNAFTEALHNELRGSGVKIQALCPGFTLTEFHDGPKYANTPRPKRPNLIWMSAEQVVAASLADLQRGKVICIPGLRYKLAVMIITGWLTRPLVRWIMARRQPQ